MNSLTKIRFPTFLGIVAVTVGLGIGVFLVQNARSLIIGAETSSIPENVRVSNVTHSSFTVTWTTEKKVPGRIKWGRAVGLISNIKSEPENLPGFTHSVTITNLNPQSTYNFTIITDADEHDNNGIPWQVKTGKSLPLPQKPFFLSGLILSPKGIPVKNSLVYVTVAGSGLLSTKTGDDGSYFIPISYARSKDFQNYIDIDEQSSLIEISAHAGFEDIAFAQIYPSSANPAPPIIINRVHDFRNIQYDTIKNIPEAEINPPQESSPSGGFEETLGVFYEATKEVTLDNTNQVTQ